MPQIEVRMAPMTKITIDGFVTCSTYRTATVYDQFMTISRIGDTQDLMDTLEFQLSEAASVSPDNHVVYSVTTSEGGHLYIMFSDEAVHFGLSVKEQRW